MAHSTRTRRDVLTGKMAPEDGGGPELHVSGLVVHVRPDRLEAVLAALAKMPGVETHGVSAAGKVVVTLETDHEQDIVQCLGAIGELPGVLSAALVSHRFE